VVPLDVIVKYKRKSSFLSFTGILIIRQHIWYQIAKTEGETFTYTGNLTKPMLIKKIHDANAKVACGQKLKR
jgi:hypothetical protein